MRGVTPHRPETHPCDDARMLEYGNGVGQVAGRSGGAGTGSGGGSVDVGASLSQLVNDSVHTISTMPPAGLLAGVVIVVLGLMMLRRVF
jgi:hypothetical protein